MGTGMPYQRWAPWLLEVLVETLSKKEGGHEGGCARRL